MKIDQSCVRMDAQHASSRVSRTEIERSVSFRSALLAATPGGAALAPEAFAAVARPQAQCEAGEDMARRVRQMIDELVSSILALFSGQNCRSGGKDACPVGERFALPEDTAGALPARPLRTMEWTETVRTQVEEHEATAFAACGTVRCADGREIAFDLQLRMARDFVRKEVSHESGRVELRDPLVINFDGKAAELGDRKIAFDLDADGRVELLPELAAGCGYLCFDAGQDGRIADGRELFGATGAHAGDGFADLARHDADGNGWIDEADPAFAAIGVWFPDGRIESLKTAGVAALHVGSVESHFALKDEDNQLRGQIARSGLYLNEGGTAGTLQQLDLAVMNPPAA